MSTITANMTSGQLWVPCDPATVAPGSYTIDSETVELGGVHLTVPALVYTPPNGREAIRGTAGSTAASHTSGATITRYYPDAPGGGSTPTLAEVLAEGNDLSGDVHKVTSPAPSPGLNGSYIELVTGGASLVGADGAAMTQGGEALISAGASNGQNSDAAYVRAYAAAADGTGGTVEVKAGDADGSSGLAGGDFTVTLGAGDGAGRNGLVFLNLPTSDPGVAGALYEDSITHAVFVSQG